MSWTIIESDRQQGMYGMPHERRIIERGGERLLIQTGFGGMDDLRGGAYRWEHGMAIRLLPTDTLDSLDLRDGSDPTDYEGAAHGDDPRRPILDVRVEQLADAPAVAKHRSQQQEPTP